MSSSIKREEQIAQFNRGRFIGTQWISDMGIIYEIQGMTVTGLVVFTDRQATNILGSVVMAMTKQRWLEMMTMLGEK